MTKEIETPTAVIPLVLLGEIYQFLHENDIYENREMLEEASRLRKALRDILNNYQWSKDA